MKKILLASLLLPAMLCNAADTMEFSYADGCSDYLGTSKKENFDVAIFLPGSQFKDYRVAYIKAPLNKTKDNDYAKYDNLSVWVSTELTLDGKVNKPDVSYPATVDENGYVSIELPETFTISEKGAYVGYSFNVTSLDSGTKYPIGIGMPMNENGLWIHSSRTYLKWTDMAEKQGYSSAITVGLQSDSFSGESVCFSQVPGEAYVSLNTEKPVDVVLATFGTAPVSSVDYEITVAGATSSYHYDLPEVVPARLGKAFNASVVIPAQQNVLSEDISLRVTKVNGVENKATNGTSASMRLNVLKFVPEHQALFEEYTGTWCGWCTRGYAALEHIKNYYPAFVTAAYHNGDPMTCMSSYPNTVSGFPGSFLDRSISGDPYYGTQKYNTMLPIVDEILAINEQYTPWSIKVAHIWDNDDTLTANVDVMCNEDAAGNFKLAYILVSDGLSGEKWAQSNNYASYAQDESVIPELNNFCHGGIYGQSSVKGLVFDDVVITNQGVKGVSGSLPETIKAEEMMSHSFTFDLTKIKPELIPDKNKLRIIVAVLDSKGRSLNCAKQDVTDYTGAAVEGVEVSDNDAPVEYYNLNGVKVSEPTHGIYIRHQGSRTSKVVIK